jgi:hypothetical protein
MSMATNRTGITLLLSALSGFVAPLGAHHSAAQFDPTRTLTLKGTVQTFEWTNPHVWIWLMVNDEHGTAQQWGIECANLAMLRRAGMDRHTLKPGDQVSLDIHPLKDGRRGGMFIKMIFADGRAFDMAPTLGPAPP